MKTFILSLILFVTSFSQATELDFLKGEFTHNQSKIIATKHLRQFYRQSPKERQLTEDYRDFGYACLIKSQKFIECSKMIETNPHQIDPKTKTALLLSPSFGKEQSIELVSETDAVTIYDVRQDMTANKFESKGYHAYRITDSGLYVDLNLKKNTKKRFQVVDENTVTHLSFEREKISKREFFLHNVSHQYIK